MRKLSDFLQEDVQANIDRAGQKNVLGTVRESIDPPKATLTRRAQSYSDFHDAVKAVLDKNADPLRRKEGEEESYGKEEYLETDLDFSDWYHDLELELLDLSHDEYT